MTEQAEDLRIKRQLEELKRHRPRLYDLIRDVMELEPAEYEEFMRQAMPIIRKYLN